MNNLTDRVLIDEYDAFSTKYDFDYPDIEGDKSLIYFGKRNFEDDLSCYRICVYVKICFFLIIIFRTMSFERISFNIISTTKIQGYELMKKLVKQLDSLHLKDKNYLVKMLQEM